MDWQTKRGFMLPFQQWLGSEWEGVLDEIDRTCPVRTENLYRKWAMFVFDIGWRSSSSEWEKIMIRSRERERVDSCALS